MNRGAVSLLTLSSPFPRAAPTRPLLRLTYDRIEHSVSSGRAIGGRRWSYDLVSPRRRDNQQAPLSLFSPVRLPFVLNLELAEVIIEQILRFGGRSIPS